MERSSWKFRTRLTGKSLSLGSTLAYLITFPPLENFLGPAVSILVSLPVGIITWYFGLTVGLVAAILGVTFHIAFLVIVEKFDLNSLIYFGLIPWPLMLCALVVIVNLLRKRAGEHEQTTRILHAREQFLASLNEIIGGLMSMQVFDPSLHDLRMKIAAIFKADDCQIMMVDDAPAHLAWKDVLNDSSPDYIALLRNPGEENLAEALFEGGHSIGIENVNKSPYLNTNTRAKFAIGSLLAMPLIARENKIGIVLIVFTDPLEFEQDDLRRADQIGTQVALALSNARKDAEIQRRLRESNALAQIGLALSETERVGLGHVLQLIVDSAQDLIPGTGQAVIHLLDKEEQALIPRAVAGFDTPDRGPMKMRLGEGVAGQVIAEGVLVSIGDIDTDSRFLRQAGKPNYRSLMVSPIQSNSERLGTISIQSRLPHSFTLDEQQLLTSLGTQAAIAIENAHLLETTQQGLKEANALYQISRGLTASLNTDELMRDVANLLYQSLKYYHVQILTIDTDSGSMVIRVESPFADAKAIRPEKLVSAGAGIVGHVLETGKSFFTNSVEEVIFFVRDQLLPDTHSELAVPILVDGRVMGVIDVQQALPGRLTERDLKMVNTVAEQLAVALQKAQLYFDLQVSLKQEQAMRFQLIQSERLALVGRLLASVSHELNNPLQAIQNALYLLKENDGISPQGTQDLQIILSETDRMAAMIRRLRASYIPTHAEDFRLVQINDVIEEVYALVATHLRQNSIAFEFCPDPVLPAVAAVADQIHQVILNLLMNGVEAMPDGGRLTVATEASNDEILLMVLDTGIGIDPLMLPDIFDPFVTNKERGTGLGLTITYDIVMRHKGRIQALNNPDSGACFKIWLPASDGEGL